MPRPDNQPILGRASNDVPTGPRAHDIGGVPDEADLFVLNSLDWQGPAHPIGIPGADEDVMDSPVEAICSGDAGDERLEGVVRDMDRVVSSMKAAASKDRPDPIIKRQLKSRAISAR